VAIDDDDIIDLSDSSRRLVVAFVIGSQSQASFLSVR
jgi:hypothetical protein